MEESKAIELLQKGDLNGLESLVKRYQTQAVQTACLIVQDRALAEDIVRNAFFTAAERIHQYDPERPFKAWFFRSVVNASIKAAKRQKKQSSLNALIPGQNFSLADVLVDTQALPEDWLENQENREAIQAAIDSLPADQRAVVVMRYFLEASESEMAGELKRPISTIKYWLRTARKALASLLNPGRVEPSPKNDQSIAVPEKNGKEA
jgi:RNA polymerase sigma-70 factor (ECF subfamily)